MNSPLRTPLVTSCAVHKHRSSVPGNQHHVWPLGMGGPDIPSNRVLLCMNGHGEVHDYIDDLIKYDGRVPWRRKIRFGKKVRDLAMRGWLEAGRPKHLPHR